MFSLKGLYLSKQTTKACIWTVWYISTCSIANQMRHIQITAHTPHHIKTKPPSNIFTKTLRAYNNTTCTCQWTEIHHITVLVFLVGFWRNFTKRSVAPTHLQLFSAAKEITNTEFRNTMWVLSCSPALQLKELYTSAICMKRRKLGYDNTR